jgi:hypothetical protein
VAFTWGRVIDLRRWCDLRGGALDSLDQRGCGSRVVDDLAGDKIEVLFPASQ